MTYNFDTEVELDFDFDYIELYQAVCDACADAEKCPYEFTVELVIVDDESIRQINKENRDIDKATDVLSFPMNNYPSPADFSRLEEDMDAFDPDTGELILGDIVLSYDHILEQANAYNHKVEREYAFLIIHSMLHLFGYDHMEEDERIVMEEHQRVILDKLYDRYPNLKVK